jgi:hypothetical protein
MVYRYINRVLFYLFNLMYTDDEVTEWQKELHNAFIWMLFI